MGHARDRALAALAGAGAAGLRVVAARRPRPCRSAAHAAGARMADGDRRCARCARSRSTAVEQRFAQQVSRAASAASTAGGDVWVLRDVARPTRALHPAGDCFRGLGYRIEQDAAAQRRRRAAVALLRRRARRRTRARVRTHRRCARPGVRRRVVVVLGRRARPVERPVARHDAGGGTVSLKIAARCLRSRCCSAHRCSPCWRGARVRAPPCLPIALHALKPAPDEWRTTVHLGPWPRELSMPGLIRWAAHPLAAPLLDGRVLHTALRPLAAATQRPRPQRRVCTVPRAVARARAGAAAVRARAPARQPRRRGPLRRHAHAGRERPRSDAHVHARSSTGAARPAS